MQNKYVFDDEHAEKVLNLLYPSMAAIEMNLGDLNDAMEELGLKTAEVVAIQDALANFEYLDELQKINDMWSDFSQHFFINVLDMQLKDDMGRPYYVFMQYYQVDELLKAIDNAIIESSTRVSKNNDVLEVEQYKDIMLAKAKVMLQDVKTIFDADEQFKVFEKQFAHLTKEVYLPAVEEAFFDFIVAFEEYNGSNQIAYEKFWQDKNVKVVCELLNRILALISFINFIDEYNWDDELVGEEE